MAEQADRHHLYQLAVQSPEGDVELLQQVYEKCRGTRAFHFREDFCGTAVTLSRWIEQGEAFSGEGYDIDPDPLGWGQEHNFRPLGAAAKRAVLHAADARDRSERPPDVRCAFNFSYWIFRRRDELKVYFRSVLEDLNDNGVFVIDLHGGTEALSEEEHVTGFDDFDLVVHQTDLNPVDNSANLALHFRFSDGSGIENAFNYRWRIWSMPELIDLLQETGFSDVQVHWYIEEEDGDSRYEVTRNGYNDPAWIACLAAMK